MSTVLQLFIWSPRRAAEVGAGKSVSLDPSPAFDSKASQGPYFTPPDDSAAFLCSQPALLVSKEWSQPLQMNGYQLSANQSEKVTQRLSCVWSLLQPQKILLG